MPSILHSSHEKAKLKFILKKYFIVLITYIQFKSLFQ